MRVKDRIKFLAQSLDIDLSDIDYEPGNYVEFQVGDTAFTVLSKDELNREIGLFLHKLTLDPTLPSKLVDLPIISDWFSKHYVKAPLREEFYNEIYDFVDGLDDNAVYDQIEYRFADFYDELKTADISYARDSLVELLSNVEYDTYNGNYYDWYRDTHSKTNRRMINDKLLLFDYWKLADYILSLDQIDVAITVLWDMGYDNFIKELDGMVILEGVEDYE